MMRLAFILASVVTVVAIQVGCSQQGENLPGIAKESTPRAIVRDTSVRRPDARSPQRTIGKADSTKQTIPHK
jgi:hypothetical protein